MVVSLSFNKTSHQSAQGWTGKSLWVDLTRGTSSVTETRPQRSLLIGGRGFNIHQIFAQLEPGGSAFDPANLLCIAPGVLTGTPAPSTARTAISALSPRGLLDSANIGGFIGAEIKFAGYDQIVITGRAAHAVYLFISNDGVLIKDARHLWGQDPWQTQAAIRKELADRDVQSMAIGVAGENRVHFAAILTGRLTSAAGRCGMGAVMGGKNLKAVAVRGRGAITLAYPQKYLAACAELREALQASPVFEARRGCVSDKSVYQRHMTEGGKFVAGNWEASDWEADGFTGLMADPEPFWQQNAQQLQAGGARQPGCFGCPMYHETFFELPSAADIGRTKCVEWLSFSGTAWLTDRHQVNQAAHLCNRLGLDAVSAGACIAFLMQLYHEGVISRADTDGTAMRHGDLDAVEMALTKIARQEGFGKWFQAGVGAAAAEIGPKAGPFAIQIKNLELMPEEIRAYKALALHTAVGKTEW